MSEVWTCNVRGGLGTQILSLYTAYAMAEEAGVPMGRVMFNTDNYPPESMKNNDINRIYFDDLLEFANRPEIYSVSGTAKTNAFHVGNIKILLRNWDKLQEKVWLRSKPKTLNRELIHIRQGDRALVNIEKFDKLISHKPDAVVISDKTWVYDRYKIKPTNDVLIDWYEVFRSKVVYAGFSSYVLLSGMFNKEQEVYFFGKDKSDLPFRAWDAVEAYVDGLPNFHWI